LFTVSEGNITKYLDPVEITKERIADVFGKEKDKQQGLGKWFG